MDATYHLTNQRRYYHPLPIFLCFTSLIILLVLIPHPVITTLSLIVSASLLVYTKQWRWRSMMFYFILYFIIAFTNPIFVTKGATVLFYFFEAPYTLEALLYGFVFANMIISIIWWCLIFNQFLSSDHIVYLFSKPFKILALIISIVFRLIPKFKKQMQEIVLYQKKYSHKSSLKKGVDAFLVMITWAFESSLAMADSMNARGYKAKRTHFHLFAFKKADLFFSLLVVSIDMWMMGYYFSEFTQFYYYPKIKPITFNPINILSYILMIGLMLLPLLFKKEEQDA